MDQNSTDDRAAGAPRRHGFLAGVSAALAMTAAIAVLRYTTTTPSLPEIVGEAIIGLMPAPVFSAILDVMQKAAKPTLYVGIFIGMLVVGGMLGRGFAWGDLTWSRAGNLAVVLWALIGVIILPVLGGGLFGGSIRGGAVTLAVQLALTVGSFAGALILFLRAMEPDLPAPVLRQERRAALAGITAGLLAVAAGGTAWRTLMSGGSPTSTVSTAQPPPIPPTEPAKPIAATAPETTVAPVTAAAPEAAATAATGPEVASAAAGAPGAAPAAGVPPRGVPRIDAPSVPLTVQPNQAAAPPFDVSKLSYEVLTPKDFYVVSKNLIDPSVDVNTWSLRVDGLVERPTTYVYTDITALPTYSDYYTLLCISNPIGGDQWGNAHWKGVRLVELLGRAGLKPGIGKVVFHADDGYTDSIPLDVALRADALLAYEMDGAPLPKEHGYPARLLIPGIYGMKNVKWITRIELVDYDFKGYWMQRGWSDSAVYQTTTRIDVPANRAQVNVGEIALGGVTFAGIRGIQRVEVSLDDGATWQEATLKPALSQNAWSLWVFRKDLAAGTYQVKARAIDGNGDVQSPFESDPLPDGATGYHSILLRVG